MYIDNGQLDLQSSTFANNAVGGGGSNGTGMHFIPALMTANNLINNVWLGTSFNASGVFIQNQQGAEVNMFHNTIAALDRQDSTSGVFCQCATPSDIVNLRNNIIVNHGVAVAQADNGTLTTQANLYFNNTANEQGVSASSGHILANPFFVDFNNGDFHLQTGSQAIDKGIDVGVTVDLEGVTRPQGKGFDIGAFEFGAMPPDPAPNPSGVFDIYLPVVVK